MRADRVTKRLLLLAALAGLSACATVRGVQVRDDYATVDRTKTLRISVITAPMPGPGEPLGQVWSAIARSYVNDHRDFLVLAQRTAATVPEDACGERIDGVLHLSPTVTLDGQDVSISARARLYRCRDLENVWSASASGSWPSNDPQLQELTARYVEKYGAQVQPFVAPSFRLLRALLDTLPRPKLVDEADVMEKIELSE